MADRVSAGVIVDASAEEVFRVLADPANHPAIDGTGWVRASRGGTPVTAAGQVFRMTMYHPNHPNGTYEMANRVHVFEPPIAIGWQPGQGSDDTDLSFPGWVWRYDLTPLGSSRTRVRLSYDWSAVSDRIRRRMAFPPFPPEHLGNSLAHLAELVTSRPGRPPGS